MKHPSKNMAMLVRMRQNQQEEQEQQQRHLTEAHSQTNETTTVSGTGEEALPAVVEDESTQPTFSSSASVEEAAEHPSPSSMMQQHRQHSHSSHVSPNGVRAVLSFPPAPYGGELDSGTPVPTLTRTMNHRQPQQQHDDPLMTEEDDITNNQNTNIYDPLNPEEADEESLAELLSGCGGAPSDIVHLLDDDHDDDYVGGGGAAQPNVIKAQPSMDDEDEAADGHATTEEAQLPSNEATLDYWDIRVRRLPSWVDLSSLVADGVDADADANATAVPPTPSNGERMTTKGTATAGLEPPPQKRARLEHQAKSNQSPSSSL